MPYPFLPHLLQKLRPRPFHPNNYKSGFGNSIQTTSRFAFVPARNCAAGKEAIEPLRKAVLGGSTESMDRSLHILDEMLNSSEEPLAQAPSAPSNRLPHRIRPVQQVPRRRWAA